MSEPCADSIRLHQAVEKILSQHSIRKTGVVVAVSGGADSVVLLDILCTLRDRFSLELVAAHLDHGWRSDSASDADFVEGLCEELGVRCVRDRLQPNHRIANVGASLENAAREARFEFLDKVVDSEGAKYVALGHHADDQAETVLMRLLRGSGLAGLSGMQPLREGCYLRPLLFCRRAEIEFYAGQRGLRFCSDSTNADVRHLRNRIRHRLLPQLRRSFNPSIVEILGRTASVLREEDAFVAECVEAASKEVVTKPTPALAVIDRNRFQALHLAIRRRILRRLLGDFMGQAWCTFMRIEELIVAATRAPEGQRALTHELRYQVTGQQLIMRNGKSHFEVDVEVPGTASITELGLELTSVPAAVADFNAIKRSLGGDREAFDADLLGSRLQLRSIRSGDVFQPLGMKGHKRVSQFLIDLGVPRILREDIFLLAKGPEVVWVAGLRPSHPFSVQSTTRRMIVASLKRRGSPSEHYGTRRTPSA